MKKKDLNTKQSGRYLRLTVILLTSLMIFGSSAAATAPTRIVVVPFYAENGKGAGGGDQTLHYRRIMRFINNHLNRHGFEIINPFAAETVELEYNKILQRAREDSALASLEICKKYGTDAAYLLWLDTSLEKTPDGYCKASGRLDGEGYDSGGRDLGVGVSKTFKVTRRGCKDARAELEKEMGDILGRTLIGHNTPAQSGVTTDSAPVGETGVLRKNIDKFDNLINLRLDGITAYEHAEIFGKVVNTVTGVLEADRYRSRIVPGNPKASHVIWRIRIEDTDPFRLQANITKMIHDILDSPYGEIRIKGVPYRYSAAEIDHLKGFRPGEASSREVEFIIDRELSRDREMTGRHDPYRARGIRRDNGFE